MPAKKIRDVIKLLEADGCNLFEPRGVIGSIITSKRGTVTVAGHPSQDMAPGTYNNILKQAGLK